MTVAPTAAATLRDSHSAVIETAEIAQQLQPHNVSSHISNKTPKLYKRHGSLKPLEYKKYLVGKSYLQFKSGIKSPKTEVMYRSRLYHFCEYLDMTTDQIVAKYGQDQQNPNLRELQAKIEDYILQLRERMDKGELKPTTVKSAWPSIKHFLEMADIIGINFKKIAKLLPTADYNADDVHYSTADIKKMLDFADLRTKIPILWMFSSGMRLGGFSRLNDGDASPIFEIDGEILEVKTDEAEERSLFERARLLAGHIVVYKNTLDEYDSFVSPEAFKTYLVYRRLRVKAGEPINSKSPILIRRFEYSPDGCHIDNRRAGYSTVVALISNVAFKAGVRGKAENYERRFDKKVTHAMRKGFKSTISSLRTKDGRSLIEPIKQEWLYGHALGGLMASSENYDRNNRVTMLLEEYVKAIPALTIDESERLNVQVKKLEGDVTAMKTIQLEVHEKDKTIEMLQSRLGNMEKMLEYMRPAIEAYIQEHHDEFEPAHKESPSA